LICSFAAWEKRTAERSEAVACDGAKGYLSSIGHYAKNALIVLDHFHIKKYLNDAVDIVRKRGAEKGAAGKTTRNSRRYFTAIKGSSSCRTR